MSTKKIGIIDVGGGMRGVYGAGLFDYLMDNEIWLPYCVGISAGSANVASYLSRQRGRNKVSYEQYSFQREYMSFHNLLKKAPMWIWTTFTVLCPTPTAHIPGTMTPPWKTRRR